MKTKNKAIKITLRIIAVIIAILLIVGIIAFIGFKFVIAPKFNANIENKDEQLNTSDFIGIATNLADKQLMDNILNFDKQSAVEALSALQEIGTEEEIEVEQPPVVQEKPKEEKPDASMSSAYERIMAAAEKDEIERGLAIMKKVSISKVTELRNSGNLTELKAYLRSCLTHEEIISALSLYNKYKHLL